MFLYRFCNCAVFFVEDKASHAALFSVAVDIEARRRREADVYIIRLSDIGIFVVMTDIDSEHVAFFFERLELAGVDIRYRRRFEQNRALDAFALVCFIVFALVYSECGYRAFFVFSDSP